MWLTFLKSHLVLNGSQAHSKWRIVLVGTCADMQRQRCIVSADYWQNQFKDLPISYQIFPISVFSDFNSVWSLAKVIESECKYIMDSHSMIPEYYCDLLNEIQKIPFKLALNESQVAKIDNKYWRDPNFHNEALDHLHAIGEIVRFGNGLICPKPSKISQIIPEPSSLSLSSNAVKILRETDHEPRYAHSFIAF